MKHPGLLQQDRLHAQFSHEGGGYSFPDAGLLLCGDSPSPQAHGLKSLRRKRQSRSPLPRNSDNLRAIAYLQSQGIDKEIIDLCIKASTLYAGEKYYNSAFIGHDKDGNACFACVRGTTSIFRQDVESSDKRFGFRVPAGL